MIDIHSHLIYGVDDGPSSIGESLRMVLEAERLGVETIIATPHRKGSLYDAVKTAENFRELVYRTRDCGVALYLGNEVLINTLLTDRTEDRNALTLNKSRYLLFELPFDTVPVFCAEILNRLHLEKIIPVIAHPERNKRFIRSFDEFIAFIEGGCLIQVDSASIVGVHGPDVKKFARKLIKLNMAHFVASDAHCAADYTEWLPAAYRLVKKWAGEEYTNKVFFENPKAIVTPQSDNGQ